MSKSFGNSVGRAIGYTAAATVNATVVAAKATGRFGQDVIDGTTDGYAEHAARFAAQRELVYGQHKSIAVAVVRPRARAKATA